MNYEAEFSDMNHVLKLLIKEVRQMARAKKPLVPITVLASLVFGIFLFSCQFSFAQDKRPEEGSIQFGAKKKPAVETTPQFEAFKSVFADVAEEVIPTVVSITSTKIDTVIYQNPFQQFFGGPLDEFFGTPQRPQQPQQQERHIPRSGFGSGVIVSPDGYILTNYHVVGDADKITIETADERQFNAEIVGIDSLSDVAVIKIKEDVRDLPVAYIGSSEGLRPGDWVMAVGNPFNLSSTVTTGIVSAVGRASVGMTTYRNFIQTDAAINPGNSGGALVNIDGELVGINTMIYTRSGGYMGIGFAIPINMAKWIMEELIYKGEVQRGWLGVEIADVDSEKKEALGLPNTKGVLIQNVYPGQPAAKAGIKAGDVVVSINDMRTENANALMNTVAGISPGENVSVDLIRNGEKMTVQVELTRRDEEKIKEISTRGRTSDDAENSSEGQTGDYTEKLGLTVGDITSAVREELNLQKDTKGVVIREVAQASKAAQEGIRKNDIITTIKVKGGKMISVNSVKDFGKALEGVESGDAVMFRVQRGERSFFIAYRLG